MRLSIGRLVSAALGLLAARGTAALRIPLGGLGASDQLRLGDGEGQGHISHPEGAPRPPAHCYAEPHPPPPGRAPRFPHPPGRQPTGVVAFGDSYSAGIGTGIDGKEDDCRRGVHAHPFLIFRDLADASSKPSSIDFQFLSCTGATTEDVLSGGDHSQIDGLNDTATADFALLSLGGNDLGFFAVMNACVFRFYSFYSGTCDTALQNAHEQIQSPEFEQRLQMVVVEMLDKVHWEKQPWFTITVTGYARFFNDETDDCDDYSFGIWWKGPKLKKEMRQRMNNLVVAVNGKIRRSVDLINSRFSKTKVLFVDYDDKFNGHRFCEPNVTEPAYNRTDTWFFLVGGEDNLSDSPNATDPMPPPPNGTWPEPPPSGSDSRGLASATLPVGSIIVDPLTCLGPALQSGDWGLLALCYMATAKHRDPSLRFSNEEIMTQNSMWYVPTYYGKTFHPVSQVLCTRHNGMNQ